MGFHTHPSRYGNILQVVDSISGLTPLKGSVFALALTLTGENPPTSDGPKRWEKKKSSVLEADLGEKWLLCVQLIIAARCSRVVKAASRPSLFVWEPLVFLSAPSLM